MILKAARLIEAFFLPIALAFSGAALFRPELFTWLKPNIPVALGVIMFGMGLTLSFADFAGMASRWKLILAGITLQYTVMPLLAVFLGRAFALPLEAALGLAIVGACPGGTASNVIAYLAKGNVALSVTMTMASTLLAPILTPAIVYALFNAQIHIDFPAMVSSIFWIVVFPLADGLILRRLLNKRIEPVIAAFPAVSILAIAAVIACVVGLNRQNILDFPGLIILAVICHNLGGFAFGYLGARLFTRSRRDAITLAIEVGMQNSGLGVALANTFFSAAAALPGAIFSLEQNLAGIVLAKYWSGKTQNDAAACPPTASPQA